jgi:hypothetical protein
MNNTKQTILDIAMNLHRIGGWVLDGYSINENKIKVFLKNTDVYLDSLSNLPDKFMPTWQSFSRVYPILVSDVKNNAENLLTWGDILTHRSKLLD